MASFGYQVLERAGKGIQVSADGRPKAKSGGITIHWPVVAAQGSAGNFNDEEYFDAGDKVLRYGTVVCKILGATANAGKFAPFGATLAGGETLSSAKGDVFVLNKTVFETDVSSDHGGEAIQGGRIFLERVLVGGGGQMSLSAFEAACPTFVYVQA